MTGGNSTYTREPITAEVVKSGSELLTYELNGGRTKLAKMLAAHVEKTGKTKTALGAEAKIGKGAFGKYTRGDNTGISLGTLKKLAKLLGISALALSRRILTYKKDAKKPKGKKPNGSSKKLGKLLAALGVGQSELACSFTIGEDRITVERMPGQEGEPVVVEHNGHRLTIAKA
jgi:transcriptional regulator with XRE-family HTH domain